MGLQANWNLINFGCKDNADNFKSRNSFHEFCFEENCRTDGSTSDIPIYLIVFYYKDSDNDNDDNRLFSEELTQTARMKVINTKAKIKLSCRQKKLKISVAMQSCICIFVKNIE